MTKKIKLSALIITASLIISGCAGIQDVGAYKTGSEISQATMDSFVDGKTKQKEVIDKIGHPNNKSQLGKVEIWNYDFTKIRHIGSNISESSVFEWNSKGILKSHYKANGRGSKTGNPLLDAAAGN